MQPVHGSLGDNVADKLDQEPYAKDNDKKERQYDYHPDIGYFEVAENGEPVDAESCSVACASAAAPEEVDFINVFGRKDELEYEQSAACAGEDTPGDDPLPSLRKSVAKAKAKHNAKANKKNGKKDGA